MSGQDDSHGFDEPVAPLPLPIDLPSIAEAAATRERLWDAGFRPVAVHNPIRGDEKSGKAPLGRGWRAEAMLNPPMVTKLNAVAHALNTGILCDGLRAVDIDVDDRVLATRVAILANHLLGEAPVRYRDSGSRVLLLYRAAEGQPGKIVLPSPNGKIEVLGAGQQFVAFGAHHSGATLRWLSEAPGDIAASGLLPVTEGQIHAFLVEAAVILGAVPPGSQSLAAARAGVSSRLPKQPAPASKVNGPLATALADTISDGREEYMRDWIWGRVLDWYRACPIPPPPFESDAVMTTAFVAWLEHVDSRIPGPHAAKAERLEAEGRGWSEFQRKWRYAMAQWDTKVAGEAGKPKPNGADDEHVPPIGEDEDEWGSAQSHPGPATPAQDWPEPVDFMATVEGAPILKEHHVPPSLWPFISDNAERMGVATSSMALATLIACAAAIHEDWKMQPKRRDTTWVESARLWGAIVGPPSVLKSPVIAVATRPTEFLDIHAYDVWLGYKAAHDAWKKAPNDTRGDEPEVPPRDRFMVESATIEALQEVLRDDSDGKLRAPLGKVLVRQDELEEFIAAMDRTSGGGKSNDRGSWLRAYNGGRHSVDRIGRGSFATKSWSCCLLGGIQPEVIRAVAQNSTDNGLLQRLMLDVPGTQAPGVDRSPNSVAMGFYTALIPAMARYRPGSDPDFPAIVLHVDAHEAREDVNLAAEVMQLMPDASSRLKSSFGKWPGLFARLCLTFHMIERAAMEIEDPMANFPIKVVQADTANRVRRYMLDILMPNLILADKLMFDTTQSEHAAWICQHILIHRVEHITSREIIRHYKALRSPEARPVLNSVMESLSLFGWVVPVQRGDKAPMRAPTAWHVNPRAHALHSERTEDERKRREAAVAAIAKNAAKIRSGK